MPREPKPYFRKAQNRWVVTIQGNRITLGQDKAEAFKKFHELMANQEQVTSVMFTLYDLSQAYLDWIEANRKPATYDKAKRYLQSFIKSVGKSIKVASLKKHHLTKWIDKPTWNSTSQNDAISTVQRMLNWAVDEEYLASSPIGKIKKPPRKTRDVVYTQEQWKAIISHATGSFCDLLDFLWSTGCRPKEARTIEARHVHDDMVIFPPDESKGETYSRVIFLTDDSKAIIHRLRAEYPTGVLFRNSRNNPWTKDAIKCRLTRISEKVGFRVIAYGARHSYATNALIKNVDPVTLAHLLGHRDTTMVAKVYSHVAKNVGYLKSQAKAAAGTIARSA